MPVSRSGRALGAGEAGGLGGVRLIWLSRGPVPQALAGLFLSPSLTDPQFMPSDTALTPPVLDPGAHSRVIEMAWQDEVSFEAIELQYGLSEAAVIALMRRSLRPSSFRLWRQRVTGRSSKHAVLHRPTRRSALPGARRAKGPARALLEDDGNSLLNAPVTESWQDPTTPAPLWL